MILTALCAIPHVTVSTDKLGIPVHNELYLKNNYYNHYYMSVVDYKSYYYAYISTYQMEISSCPDWGVAIRGRPTARLSDWNGAY